MVELDNILSTALPGSRCLPHVQVLGTVFTEAFVTSSALWIPLTKHLKTCGMHEGQNICSNRRGKQAYTNKHIKLPVMTSVKLPCVPKEQPITSLTVMTGTLHCATCYVEDHVPFEQRLQLEPNLYAPMR